MDQQHTNVLEHCIESDYMKACDNGMDFQFAIDCLREIFRRINSGRSFDCDEYRTLQHWAHSSKGQS